MTPCPCCGDKRAYVGFTAVECPTPKCRNYKGAMAGTEADDTGEDTLCVSVQQRTGAIGLAGP